MAEHPSQTEEHGRILPFRHRRSDELVGPEHPLASDHLAKYEHGDEPDDYRHRMLMNGAAFILVVALMGAGLWLATTMADLRKNQDCALSGRRNCVPVEVDHHRW